VNYRATIVYLEELAAPKEGTEAAALAAFLQSPGRRVVLTNGCFDILHAGHVNYLEKARERGDFLVVGLNDDQSVRILKGPGRPINPVHDRAAVLAALRAVDAVVIFPNITADELIRVVRPQFYVKGADYREETLPEAKAARAVGAELYFVPLLPGHSTTSIVSRLGGSGTI